MAAFAARRRVSSRPLIEAVDLVPMPADGDHAVALLGVDPELAATPQRRGSGQAGTAATDLAGPGQSDGSELYDHGVAATSLGDVQNAAGVGPSQVYYYPAEYT
jgi:hypothetical protein